MKNSRKKTTECKQKKLNLSNNVEQQYPNVDDVIGELDVHLFHEGKHYFAYQFMGAHACIYQGIKGIRFTTWAPNATSICVIGDFSDWKTQAQHYMERISEQGLWSIFVANVKEGVKYKFVVENGHIYSLVYKCDPYAFYSELRPQTASIVYTHQAHVWNDRDWMEKRKTFQAKQSPINIYELHLASWKKNWSGGFVTYYELCELLPAYLLEMGYTHVEIMPLHEHPLDKSWGYQSTSYFSATSRHGDLQGLKQLIDVLHQANIGVILDWVAGHFGKDEHGLINFDGGATYEYQDYWRANNVGWGAHNFDLGRNEVKSFLISNAMYWLQEFHIDGLRMDAVSNVLYLSYDREEGEWQPNVYGGNQNLQAIDFLKEFNYAVHQHFPGILTIAEESTAWAGVTNSIENGGLGFDFKWNMGWMNDTLSYLPLDPIYRKYHHNKINFSMIYQYSEHFILSISHDEVVHGKGSLISKMWGDIWNKHASLRLYMLYQMGHPGKKLIFMGTEFGQFTEWQEAYQLPWEIIGQYQTHAQTHYFFKQLNHFYRAHPALWEMDSNPQGFEWIDANNSEQSILSFIRYNANRSEMLVFVCNFTPVRYENYHIGVPVAGNYQQIFNSDAPYFGGAGHSAMNEINSNDYSCHNFNHSLCITIPAMAGVVFKLIH